MTKWLAIPKPESYVIQGLYPIMTIFKTKYICSNSSIVVSMYCVMVLLDNQRTWSTNASLNNHLKKE